LDAVSLASGKHVMIRAAFGRAVAAAMPRMPARNAILLARRALHGWPR